MAPQSSTTNPKPARKKAVHRPRKTLRSHVSLVVSLLIGATFMAAMALMVEARHNNFYGTPLLQRMYTLALIHLQGLPPSPEAGARIESEMPSLNLLPPEAILPRDTADRLKRVGITFAYVQQNVRPGNGIYQCRATNLDLIPAVAANIAAALSTMPDNVLQSMQLHTIVFCGDLYQGGKKVGGFPVPQGNLMMLNLTHRTRDIDIQDFFLHEFYHLFEARFNITTDLNWNKLYGGYSGSYLGVTNSANNVIGTGNPGFINRYAQSYPYEDRAEIFAKLMTARPQLLQQIRDRGDTVLYSKVQYVAETARMLLHINIAPL